jgi:hypothetical protein
MKYLLLALGLAATAPVLVPTSAQAVVCARGYYRGGCVGPNGAVVRHHPAYVAPRPVYVAPVRHCYWRWVNGRQVRVCG